MKSWILVDQSDIWIPKCTEGGTGGLFLPFYHFLTSSLKNFSITRKIRYQICSNDGVCSGSGQMLFVTAVEIYEIIARRKGKENSFWK